MQPTKKWNWVMVAMIAILSVAITAPVARLSASTDKPLVSCADYVCQFNQQCTKPTVGCASCAGIRCSDVQ